MAGKHYQFPPLIEMVCEFRFAHPEGETWDLTIPGRVYDQLEGQSGDFPIIESAASRVEINLTTTPSGIVPKLLETRDRAQFFNQERTVLVQVAPFLLAINHLAPYSSWDEFLPKVKTVYDAYRSVVQPTRLERLGLRCINKIKLPSPTELEDFFEFTPFRGKRLRESLAENFVSFIVGLQIPFDQERDILKLQLASGLPEEDSVVAILDLDYVLAKPGEISLDDAIAWFSDSAHMRVETAFEASITQRLREQFKESS